MLAAGLNSHNKEKASLIEKITANEKNVFTKEALEVKELSELQGIAALALNEVKEEVPAPAAAPTFFGQNAPAPVTNEEEDADAPLEAPVMNWENE